jgi:DNA-binding MarR family transcriptional regulator
MRPSPPSPDDALALLHFAFREIVKGPDAVLAARGLGRLHHRILYMCRRNERLAVHDLLAVLEITKQALHRPLEELVRQGLVDKTRDPADGRARRLVLTARGRDLERRLSEPQRRAFARAFAAAGPAGAASWAIAMRALADGKSEASLLRRTGAAGAGIVVDAP